MGILDKINLALGLTYNRYKHSFHTDKLRQGEMMKLSENEFIKNEKNRIIYCKINRNGKFICKKTPIKYKPMKTL